MKVLHTIDDATTFTKGYFVKNPNKADREFNSNGDFVVTLKNNRNLKEKLIETIQSAKHYIKICSFIVSDQEIVGVLEDVLRTNKVAVFILTSVRSNQFESNLLIDDENIIDYKEQHFECIDRLLRSGAHIRAHEGAHAKFIIRDGHQGLLMSANIVETCLNKNAESGFVITKRQTVDQIEHIFDIIYEYGTEYGRIIPTKSSTYYQERKTIVQDKMFPVPDESGLLWTFGKTQTSLYKEIVDIIKNADVQLDISTWSIVNLENISDLVDAIREYIEEKNGNLRIFCRAMNFRADHLESCNSLAQLGCTIFGDVFNHSKGIIDSSGLGFFFTANIDGNHGLTNGFEMGLNISKDKKQLNSFRSFINWQIDTAPYIFIQRPSYKDLKEFYIHNCDIKKIKSPLESGKEISFFCKKEVVSKKFLKDIKVSPIYRAYLKEKANNSNDDFIRTGKKYYKLRKTKNNHYNLLEHQGFRRDFKDEYFWDFKKLTVVKEG